MTVQDQYMKAETLWAPKTASENFSFRVSDGVPELISKDVPRLNYSKTHDNEQNQSKLHDKSWTWTLLSPADS